MTDWILRRRGVDGGGGFILAFSREGLEGVAEIRAGGAALGRGARIIPAFSQRAYKGGLHTWGRGRPARGAALARGDTLILAFSRKGRRDPLASIRT